MNKIESSKRPWLICLLAACFFSYELVQLHMLNALSKGIMTDFHLNATQFATISSTYLLADVLFLIPAGVLIDRFSVRSIILAALVLCILGTIGFALAQSWSQAAFFHFFSGIGNAFCFLSCMTLAEGWFKERKTFVMSVMVTIGLLGGVIAQVPFSILSELYSWRKVLLIDALIGSFILFLSYIFVFDARSKDQLLKRRSARLLVAQLKQALSLKEVYILGFYTGLMNLPLMIISAMMGNLFLTQVHRFSETQAAFSVSFLTFGTIIGSTLFGWLSERYRLKRPLLILGAFSSFILFGFVWLMPHLTLLAVTVSFFAIGLMSSTQVLSYPMITDAAPEEMKGMAMSFAALIIMGSAFLLQPIFGIVLDWKATNGQYGLADFFRAFSLFPIAFAISVFLAWIVKEKKLVLVKSSLK